MYEKYENINKALMWERVQGTQNNSDPTVEIYDLKVVGLETTEQFFSLTRSELNSVLKAFKVMNDRRYGRARKDV